MRKAKVMSLLLCALCVASFLPCSQAHASTLEEDANSYLQTNEGKTLATEHSGSYTYEVDHSTNIVTLAYFDGYKTTFKLSNNLEKKQEMTKAWDSYASSDIGSKLLLEHGNINGVKYDYSINVNTSNDTITVAYKDGSNLLFSVIENTVTNISDSDSVKVNGYNVPKYLLEADDNGLNAREKYIKYHGDPSAYDALMSTGSNAKASNIDSNGNAVTMNSSRTPNCWISGKYYDNNGYNVTGWKHLEDCWYYFDSEGLVKTGWQKINGSWYLLNSSSGELQFGWHKVNGAWYYLNSSTGKMQTGWLYGGKDNWYYLNPNSGAMQTGWNKVGNNWYYMDNKGSMKTGWFQQSGNWYFLDTDNGNMRTGWVLNSGSWYYMKADGSLMMSNFKLGGVTYEVNSGGACKW